MQETVEFASITNSDVHNFIKNADNSQLLLNILRQSGTPFDVSTPVIQSKKTREHVLEIFDSLLRVEKYGWFIAQNCRDLVHAFFTENLLRATEWLQRLTTKPTIKSTKSELEDLQMILYLLRLIMVDDLSDS